MVGLLKGGTKALFGELLGPLYCAATLTDKTAAYAGDGTLTRGTGDRSCLARVESASKAMRETPGYVATNRAIVILASSVEGDVTTDSQIEILEGDYTGAKFGIESVDRPPGASYFLCRGSKRGG